MATGIATRPSYPKVGETFEISINGDDESVQPLEMVRRTGNDLRGWTHNGRLITGRAVRPFKLVKTVAHGTFDEVLIELSRYGRVPEGQWACSFKFAFPKPNCTKHIAIADATWVGPDGRTYFPYISRAGDPRFHRSKGSFGGDCWLWIVGEPFVVGGVQQ